MTQKFKKRGGTLNTLINKLPFELHIPSYNYCGPGTKLNKRLSRRDKGINPLDEACKEHDIAYSKYSHIKDRNKADQILAKKAFQRFQASDSTFGEKIAALGVSGIMKAKSKLGMGVRKTGKGLKRKKSQAISFQSAVQKIKRGIVGKRYKNLQTAAKDSWSIIKNQNVKRPTKRIIPIPKSGGFLPLIPLFSGLAALGALGSSAAAITKAVTDTKNASQKLQEQKRHNQSMEAIAVGKKGSGLYLKPYKKGCGLFLKPYQKNC